MGLVKPMQCENMPEELHFKQQGFTTIFLWQFFNHKTFKKRSCATKKSTYKCELLLLKGLANERVVDHIYCKSEN